MAATSIILAVVIVLVPYCAYLWHLYLISFIMGIGYGVYFNSNNVWILELFEDNAGPIFQLSGFVYGIGTILGPLLYQSYVTGEIVPLTDDNIAVAIVETNGNATGGGFVVDLPWIAINSTDTLAFDDDWEGLSSTRRSQLKVPFFISGLLILIGGVTLLVLYIFRKYRINRVEIVKGCDGPPGADSRVTGNTLYGKLIIILCMLLFSFHCASDDSYVQFAATYLQYIPLGLSAGASAKIVSYMGLAFTLSQAVSVVVALKLRPHWMLGYHFLIMLAGILLMYFGKHSLGMMWAGILVMAVGIGAVFPLIFSFMAQQIDVTDRIGTLLNFSSKIPGLFVPTIIGMLVEKHPECTGALARVAPTYTSQKATFVKSDDWRHFTRPGLKTPHDHNLQAPSLKIFVYLGIAGAFIGCLNNFVDWRDPFGKYPRNHFDKPKTSG
ncbi:unnamed protein product [Medioppia subpectinata]|uniref:Uncharacterized protein n=1 Tax=Medioppia subpectinata TaxID=1979941 RepID=A0A7R9PTY0_9ACAR|nr:unnamed protein product [Medioppia subpectinata]CAG2100945.1 unnamed protein product [Medioppia subpectinata]